jgi:hypothetical protein
MLKPDFALAYLNRGYAHRELYGEREGVNDWRIAANLFKEQNNFPGYQSTIDLINLTTSIDTLSGMLS